MPEKGTFAALKGARAAQVDFGAVTKDVAGAVEGVRQSKLKEDLLKAEQARKEKEYTRKLRAQADKDTAEFAKEASKMLDIDTTGMMNPILTKYYQGAQKNYANLVREYRTAGTEKRTELRMKLHDYLNMGKNISAGAKGFSDLFKDYNDKVGKKGGYSAYSSSASILSAIKTISSAADKGLTENEDGSFSWGDYITISGMGTADMKLNVKDKDGKQLADNYIQNIATAYKGGLKPYADISGMAKKVADAVDISFNESIEEYGGYMDHKTMVNKGKTMKSMMLATQDMIGNNQSLMDELRNSGAYGDDPKEIIKRISNNAYDMKVKNEEIQRKKSGTYASGKRKYEAEKKKEAVGRRVSDIKSVLEGNKEALSKVNDKDWTIDADEKGNAKTGKVRKITLDKDGNTLTVRIGYKKKRALGGERELFREKVYNFETLEQREKLIEKLNNAFSQDIGQEKIMYGDLNPEKNILPLFGTPQSATDIGQEDIPGEDIIVPGPQTTPKTEAAPKKETKSVEGSFFQ